MPHGRPGPGAPPAMLVAGAGAEVGLALGADVGTDVGEAVGPEVAVLARPLPA